MRRWVIIIAGVIVVALALCIGAFFIEFNAPGLGRTILADASDRTGVKLDAQGFRFKLSRGLRLEGVTATVPMEDGGRLDVKVDSLILEHEFLPLLRRRLVFDEVVLDGATFHLEPAPARQARRRSRDVVFASLPPAAPERQAASPREPQIAIRRVAVRRGTFTTKTEAGDPVEINGIEVEIGDVGTSGDSIVRGLEGSGTIVAETMAVGPFKTGRAEGKIAFAAGHVIVDDFEFPTDLGSIVCRKVDLDLTRDPFGYSLSMSGDPLKASRLLDAAPGAEIEATFDLEGEGRGPDTSGFDGWGTVKLSGGTIPSAPLLDAIDMFIDGEKIVGSSYDDTEIRFHMANESIALEPFEVKTDLGKLGVKGRFGVDGKLDLDIALLVPRDYLKLSELPKELIKLLSNTSGEIALPIRVTGTMDSPDVRPDWDALRAAMTDDAKRSLLDRLGEKIGVGLGKLFGDGKD